MSQLRWTWRFRRNVGGCRRRAGFGIATLYRRFPDRASLMRAVVLGVLARTADAARTAEAEEADAFTGLACYIRRALDLRISAVMPVLVGHVSFEDAEFKHAREEAVQPVLRLIGAAQAAGRLRSDVAFGDIGLLLVRITRPLPGPFPRDLDLRLAHRHLDLLLAALEVRAESSPIGLSGPALTLGDLQNIGARPV